MLALPVPGAEALDVVAGLPLALRTVLTLQKQGFDRIALVVPEDQPAIAAAIRGDRRAAEIEVVMCNRTDLEPLLEAAGREPFVLALHHVLVDPALYRQLGAAALDDRVAVVLRDGGRDVGPLLATPAFVDALASEADGPLAMRVARAVEALVAAGRASHLDVEGRWSARADEPAGRRRAVEALFDACRKPVDGLVSRHLNRHVSIFLSKRLVDTPITPNMTSVVTFLFAIAGAACVAQGGYVPMLVGAALFQWNSILDGVDGELARVRFQQSRLGQWVDTVSDDLSSLVFYGGLIVGSAALPHGTLLAIAGAVAMASLVGMAAQYYVELVRMGSGDFYSLEWDFKKQPKKTFFGRVADLFSLVLKKDAFIFCYLVMAVFGVLPWALAAAAVGHFIAFAAATARTIGRAAKRR